MNSDSYYEIGHSHIVCEDYALSGHANQDICFAIVSDGCSSSKDVDVGARVLAHSAKNFLCNEYINNIDVFKDMKANDFFNPIISSAYNIVKQLGLNIECLDATLLMAICDGKEIRVFAYGDGCIVIRQRNGLIKYFRIEYLDGAPYYLSYSLDFMRKNGYLQEFKQKAVIHECEMVDGVFIEKENPSYYDIVDIYNFSSWTFSIDDVSIISLISDGIVSYENIINNRPADKLPISKVINRISGFKNFHGKFVERRMNNFKKECQKENIGHYDDIGIASIFMPK